MATGMLAVASSAPAANRSRTEFRQGIFEDFENPCEWQVETVEAKASFERERGQAFFGDWAGKLTYRGTGAKASVRLRPVRRHRLGETGNELFSAWIRGQEWGAGANRQFRNPSPEMKVHFRLQDGSEKSYSLGTQRWKGWHLPTALIPKADRLRLAGAEFDGFSIVGCTQPQDLTLRFDALAMDADRQPPLTIAPRPKRNLTPLPDADPGINTGDGTLTFPIREKTILPPTPKGAPVSFAYGRGQTGPSFTVKTADGPVEVFADGGVLEILDGAGQRVAPTSAAELSSVTNGEDRIVRWRYAASGAEAVVAYTFRTWGNSLVIDLACEKGRVVQAGTGDLAGADVSANIRIPYYAYGHDTGGNEDPRRPEVAVFGKTKKMFRFATSDWYRSNASLVDGVRGDNGRVRHYVRYLPKTNGSYVPLSERFFVSVSDVFEDVLPSIPNPVSPWRHVTGRKLWRAHGASDRRMDAAFWRAMHRYGMTEVVVNDHETMWRDGGEPYTQVTTFAEGRGGDEAQYEYTRLMIDELGYRYGPYNNFWDHAPANPNFASFDDVTRLSSGALLPSWMRTYAPKVTRAPEWTEKYVPVVQDRMRFNTVYCDCHTAGTPWIRTDYDARVPGAATFGAAYYATGDMLLRQRALWNGPVYSEGCVRMFYVGLTDGNYGDDRGYDFATMPWLVDFDLREIHPRECDFGMGALMMFRPSPDPQERSHHRPHCPTPASRDALVDFFLTATTAFGHSGFLIADWCFDPARTFGPAYGPEDYGKLDIPGGLPIAWRSYYLIQAAAARYTQAQAKSISYVNGRGACEDTTAAVLSGTVARRQLAVAYDDGTRVVANGNDTERLKATIGGRALDLPPYGFVVWTEDGQVFSESSDRGGHRADYAESPDYIYFDGRGKATERARAKGTGPAVCRTLADGWEIIDLNGDAAFRIDGGEAVALDCDRREIGEAETVSADGWYRVKPVRNAVSYRVRRGGFVIAERGRPAALTIVRTDPTNAVQRFAAEEFRDHVKRMTGVELPIATKRPASGAALVLSSGHYAHDGFRLQVADGELRVMGGERTGVLYGVYELLERFGGCAWFSHGSSDIPNVDRFSVPAKLDDLQKPSFVQRDTSWYWVCIRNAPDGLFAARMRLNGTRTSGKRPELGGESPHQFDTVLGNCHTFEKLIPSKEYFKDHPEYFSEVKGHRLGTSTQLCLSNPDVERIVLEKTLARIRANPGIRYFGISQNDWDNWCTCKNCRAIDDEEGSPSGSYYRFVNRIAEQVEKEFPNVIIETLAYSFTRRAPKFTKPRKNVMPCLCSIECDFSKPFATSRAPANVAFRESIRTWRDISNVLYVWDYTTNYKSYLHLFPNVPVIGPNLRFFRDNGVTHIYEQGGGESQHGEFAELKCWLVSKFEWNCDQPLEPLLDRFFTGYYGPAAPFVREYYERAKAVNDVRDETVDPLGIFEDEAHGSYTDAFYDEAAKLWEKAAEAVRDADPKYREAVKWGLIGANWTRIRRFVASEAGAPVVLTAHPECVDLSRRAEMREITRRLLAEIHKPPRTMIRENAAQNGFLEEARLQDFVDQKGAQKLGSKLELEEDFVKLVNRPNKPLVGKLVDDPLAANDRAAELFRGFGWSYTMFMSSVGVKPGTPVRFRARVRIDKVAGKDGIAFTAGAYDCDLKKYAMNDFSIKVSEMADGYAWYEIGTFKAQPAVELWFMPTPKLADGTFPADSLFIDKIELSLANETDSAAASVAMP